RDNQRKLFHRNHEDIDQLIVPYDEDFDKSVLTAVKGLPAKFSELIYLHYYEGYSTRELAEMLNRNENTVKSQLKRGREMLKGAIENV
ncbi:MAG: sigma-70 family RNA polymerase sigma factor, partial [Bacillota bacterium]